jgi:hypothetical protein
MTYQEEQRAKRIQLEQLVLQIASFFAEWRVGSSEFYIWMTGPNGEKIYFGNREKVGTLHIYGEYPRDKRGQDCVPYSANRPSVNVSLSRSPEAIAKDIQRRFLPDYVALLETVRSRVEATNKHYDIVKANVELLAKAAKAKNYKPDAEGFSFYDDAKGYGDIQVSANTATLKLLSVPIETARKILELLTKGA